MAGGDGVFADARQRRALGVDRAAQLALPSGVAFRTERIERAVLDDRGGAQRGPRDRVDPADVAVVPALRSASAPSASAKATPSSTAAARRAGSDS